MTGGAGAAGVPDVEPVARIVSRSNERLKSYRRLERREARRESGLLAAEGIRLVAEALRSAHPVSELFLADDLNKADETMLLDLLAGRPDGRETRVARLPAQVFAAMAHTAQPQGAAATVLLAMPADWFAASKWRRMVVAHEARDPGNVGALLRAAEAAGVDGVIFTGNSCDPTNPKAVRASMGSLFRLPVLVVADGQTVVDRLTAAGVNLAVARPRAARSLYDLDLPEPWCVVFGGETGSLPAGIDHRATPFSLPMAGRVESLNLAQAVTAVLFELRRRGIAPDPPMQTLAKERGRP